MIGFHQSAFRSMPFVFLTTIGVLLSHWKMDKTWMLASITKGAFIAGEIILIIFGAILLLTIMKRKHLGMIQRQLNLISNDKRVQLLLIGWLFIGFIEGIAGFGVPAALAAPLLVAIGFTPLAAVVLALIADSTAVTFGAIGIPITYGLAGMGTVEITAMTAMIHFFIGSFIPLLIMFMYTRFFATEKKMKKMKDIIPLTLFAGFCFTIPYYLTAIFLGPEFPSIFGGIIGMGAFIMYVKKRKIQKSFFTSITPYIAVATLLVLAKIFQEFLSYSINTNLFSTLAYSFKPLLNPGLIFILVALYFVVKRKEAVKETLKTVWKPFITLIFAIGVVQLFLNSGHSQLDAIPLMVGKWLATYSFYPLLSPFVGAFGTFIAGSSTISNLFFGSFQQQTAIALGISPIVLLSMQAIGSAVGNMIAIHNVIAACAVVHLKQEGMVIRYNIIPMMLYCLIAGLIGLMFI